ncbi:MAG: MiaB/RimO family radical SAM methylthiotransferase, partial [Candidatus Hydrogenedentes bacterium]|nr:MiaB/RimO family radical SAM methylthiotransferase [Candidatus Hydrogenedentota bacterium]
MRVGVITLGCDKNTVDNEYLAGMLAGAGCELVTGDLDEAEMDAVVITTCGFIGRAKEQSVQAIVDMCERKTETGNPGRVYVAGCRAQRYADDLLNEMPEIDGLVGVGQFDKLAQIILSDAQADQRNAANLVPQVDIYRFMQRRRLDNRPHAFLKLADGCNHACTFCSIPLMKGKLRSVPPEILLQEARALVDQGVKEINLVAQDLADYGRDRWKDYRLPQLLKDLCAIDGDFWVRCFYLYPGGINDAVLETLATEPKIVPYVDMPLQHLDLGVLRRMKRPYREVNTFKLVERMRAAVPTLVLRTTMIVGFPGETDEDFEATL